MGRSRLAAPAALAVVLAVAGCGGGGGGTGGYFEQETKLENDLAKQQEKLQNQASSTPRPEVALAKFGQLASLFDRSAKELAALSPPSNAAAAQAKAVARLRDLAGTLRDDVAPASRCSDPLCQAHVVSHAVNDYNRSGNGISEAMLNIAIKEP